jgi:hypothetical protein
VRHTVKLHGVTIGHSELEESGPASRQAAGQFRPALGYELVQPIFRLYSEAVPLPGGEPRDEEKLARYYAARDRLGLELVDAGGRTIATNAIHIADYGEGQRRVEILLAVGLDDEG